MPSTPPIASCLFVFPNVPYMDFSKSLTYLDINSLSQAVARALDLAINIPTQRKAISRPVLLTSLALGVLYIGYKLYWFLKCQAVVNTLFEKDGELKQLFQNMQELTSFENFNPNQYTSVCTRTIFLGRNKKRNVTLFIKSPDGKNCLERQERAKNEQLAFLISHRLGLGVAPPTIALEGYAKELDLLLPYSVIKRLKIGLYKGDPFKGSYHGVVIQKGILLEDNQDNLKRDDSLFSLEKSQIQRDILFNLVAARDDATSSQTVVVSPKKVMEVDNEKLGYKTGISMSWLVEKFPEMIFEQEVIDPFLAIPEDAIESIFKEMKNFAFDFDIQKTISDRFRTIRRYFEANKTTKVSVKNLSDFIVNAR